MRLFLLPISTRRTLLYCERLQPPQATPHQPLPAPTKTATENAKSAATPTAVTVTETETVSASDAKTSQLQAQSLVDKVQERAARLWADWEKKPTGTWQRRVVNYGNAGFRRIPFEEWGLKSVPPLKRQEKIADSMSSVDIVFPPSVIPPGSVLGLLQRLSTERDGLHRRRLVWCLIGMPISAPIALLPVIPNIPFFYLVYRAWSHWRAISGGKHIQFLLQHEHVNLSPSPILDAIYTEEKTKLAAERHQTAESTTEAPLLSNPDGAKAVSDAFDSPQLELELERAVWQVETTIAKEKVAAPAAEEKQRKP